MHHLKNGDWRYSPSDLTAFYACDYIAVLDILSASQPLEKKQDDNANQLLQKKGLNHEAAYLQQLKDSGKQVVEISQKLPFAERVEQTKKAIDDGADVVFQAVFYNHPWRGDADFLLKCDTPSQLGNFSYEVLDTKLAKTPNPKHIIQLCMYSDFLSTIQNLKPQNMYLFLGNGVKKSYKTSDFYYYYKQIKQRFEQHVNNLPTDAYPTPCQFCKFCKWENHCTAQWQKDDHLSILANITRQQIDKLQQANIHSINGLAMTSAQSNIGNFNSDIFQRLHRQATLQHHKAMSGENKVEILEAIENKGFSRIPHPTAGDLFFDMEGDPFSDTKLEYLFGVYFIINNNEQFVTFWGHNQAEEKEAFKAFMQFTVNHLRDYPNAYIYHYNHYETTALKRLASQYAVCEEALDNLLRQQKFVDLYYTVRESIQTSEPAYSIKNLETFYMQKRDDAITSAGDSVVMYNQWRDTGDDTLLDDIAQYNKVDCVSTLKLRDWLLSLKPAAIAFFTPTANKTTTPQLNDEKKEWEIQYENYQKKLSANQKNTAINQKISGLLEFHNREAKPQWWDLFNLQNKLDHELIDYSGCLANMQLQNKKSEKYSSIYCYHFPEQDHKFKVGLSVLNATTLEAVGTITHLDDKKRTIEIKRGNRQPPLANFLSICLPAPINSATLRDSIYDYADHLLDKSNTPSLAITELLAKNPPRINGITSGHAIGDACYAIANLNNSYLIIQGPPGTGKTHSCSHIIVDLIKQGKTIGITSNSHKAIHNLLQKIETVAVTKGVDFTGVKKASKSNDDSLYDSTFFTSEFRTADINTDAHCIAGTAWTFAHPLFTSDVKNPILDYLFIDEAGQVATANVVAMGTAARNIILVGDNMQLGQPIQGTHPDEAGTSVLEYLLSECKTIPPERGIFLEKTYRLHPSVCQFISDAFYDSRLLANTVTGQRRLDLQSNILKNQGITVINAQHDNCAQKSPEEAAIITQHYKQVIGKAFTDENGNTRVITEDDILIVTPYNMQVNLLKTMLPNARIGTVDKFQGQEAPIVFISMVTSNTKSLQHNVEFLFSRNRLNVALSRAQCLAVVVINPDLLSSHCSTVAQMRLINTLCWLSDYAQQQ